VRLTARPGAQAARVLPVLAALTLLVALSAVGSAQGERAQSGNLIVSLDGSLAPLKLPRDRLAPVSVSLEGGLQTADGEILPRVTEIELGLPSRGVVSAQGLPTCSQRLLLNATTAGAEEACGDALVGHGRLRAEVLLPNQEPFRIHANLLAFNGTFGGRRAVLVHAFAAKPPTVVVLPFVFRQGSGRFGTALVADLAPTLGPWPHFAHFQLTLGRRYTYRGRSRSYLSASCPIPANVTAAFFSLAKVKFTLADGSEIGTGIARGCRAS
jgi:hypothetical protein